MTRPDCKPSNAGGSWSTKRAEVAPEITHRRRGVDIRATVGRDGRGRSSRNVRTINTYYTNSYGNLHGELAPSLIFTGIKCAPQCLERPPSPLMRIRFIQKPAIADIDGVDLSRFEPGV